MGGDATSFAQNGVEEVGGEEETGRKDGRNRRKAGAVDGGFAKEGRRGGGAEED
jgi:hypothetical protein